MFVGERLIYLELQKTGSTHVRELLKKHPELVGRLHGKHNALYEVDKQVSGDVSNKIVVGNVRNPWDWYVSLWAYGCMGKGGVHAWTTRTFSWSKSFFFPWLYNPVGKTVQLFHADEWKAAYADAASPRCFQKWLSMVLSKKYAGDVGEGYARSNFFPETGFMTYRYARLYWNQKIDLQGDRNIFSQDETSNAVDVFLRTESLHGDLKRLYRQLDLSGSIPQNAAKAARNPSRRRDYRYYYNEACREMVDHRDRLIIEKHDYRYE